MNEKEINYYFWLGEDGEVSELTEEEFKARVREEEELYENWLNAGLQTISVE
jgi:hypothetical protein